MSSEIFVDTSGFYAVLIEGNAAHEKATSILHQAAETKRRFVTTDYILDETTTLLKSRGYAHLLPRLLRSVFDSDACRVEWMDRERFMRTWHYLRRHEDKDWSFTDCFSFWLMEEYDIGEALSTDDHFRQAGYIPLLG